MAWADFHCDECRGRTWQGRCSRSRCPVNSERYLRRRGEIVRLNLQAFGGDLRMLTLTGPGGLDEVGTWAWNADMYRRWKRLRDAASKHARRRVPRQRVGLLAYVPELQVRGALHLHVVLGAHTMYERRWCEHFWRYCRRHAVAYGFGPQSRVGATWERGGQRVTGYVSKITRYVSKAGGLRTMYENGELPARAFYVARRLTDVSGCTERSMRRRGAAWGRWRLAVPVGCLGEWRQYERNLGRELNRQELACLPGVRPRRT